MKITYETPPPPPREIKMVFPQAEGWAIAAALVEYAANHPAAVERDRWREWAKDLDKELRRF